jgi:hypothetical protein
MGDTLKVTEQFVAVGVRVKIRGSIRDDPKVHIEPVHLCEIDVLPNLTDCIGQGFEFMLLKHGQLLALSQCQCSHIAQSGSTGAIRYRVRHFARLQFQ